MRCKVCVGVVERGARFCPECGTRVSVTPPVFRSRMVLVPGRRRRVPGVLWCCVGLGLVGAAVGLRWVFGLVWMLGVLAGLSFAAGYGLLRRRS